MSATGKPDAGRGAGVVSRRHFVAALAAAGAAGAAGAAAGAVALDARRLGAQESQPVPEEPAAQGSDPAANQGAANVPMNEGAYRPVRRPPKPGAAARLSAAERDALEHHIHCQCGCVLDIYTCRTTDFSCGVSPAMHADVLGLVEGGYSADEIVAAFRDAYGERVLMAPPKQGFNWAGYVTPFAALGTGAVVVASLIRKWGRRAAAVRASSAPTAGARHARRLDELDATDDELARVAAAVRGDGTDR